MSPCSVFSPEPWLPRASDTLPLKWERGMNLQKIFSVTMTIYVLLALIIMLLAETVGLWFVNTKLVIPTERMVAARWIYQFAILSFMVTLLTTPYMASIIAHENMNVYAYVSIVEAALKLGIVFVLQALPYDKLTVYGGLLLIVACINTGLYRGYCKKHYSECRFRLVWDKNKLLEICGFTGWSLFGTFTSMVRTQAITILVNQFFTPAVVVARSVSTQVTNALNVFSSNFNTSLYAPIVKEYAGGKKEAVYALIFSGCKITFFLMWIFALPLYLRMEYVLTLWLKNLPEYVVLFTQLSVVEVLITSVSLPLMTAARASGKVKVYELVLGSLQLCMFAGSYIWLKFFNGGPESVFIAAIVLVILMFFARLMIVNKQTGLPLRAFAFKVIIPVGIISICSAVPTVLINQILPQNFISLCAVCVVSVLLSSVCMFAVGISQEIRIKLLTRLKIRKINS